MTTFIGGVGGRIGELGGWGYRPYGVLVEKISFMKNQENELCANIHFLKLNDGGLRPAV